MTEFPRIDLFKFDFHRTNGGLMNRSDFLVEIEKFFAIDDRKEVAKILIDAGKLTLDEAVSLLQVSKRDIQRYMK